MPSSSRRVLCIEDHEDTAFLLSTLLRQEGYEVQLVSNVSETLRLVEDDAYDLIVLDKLLPDGNGLDLCRELRHRFPQTSIIVYAATAFESDERESFLAGATDYVAKPGIQELLEAVRRQLQRSRKTRDTS